MQEEYVRLDKIGEGTYATVHRARDPANRLVALKDIFVNQEEGCPSTALREIALLKEIGPHPNVISLLKVLHAADGSKLTLVFEHCQEDLKQYMDRRVLEFSEIKALTRQLVEGVHACHSKGIIHRDLKPQNLLLLDAPGKQQLKIADFGLARGTGIPVAAYSNEVVTLWYRAPELLLGAAQYGGAVDMWAVGCIVAEMIRKGKPLLPGQNSQDQLRRFWRVLGPPSPQEWAQIEQALGREFKASEEYPRGGAGGGVWSGTLGLHNPVNEEGKQAVEFCRACLQYVPGYRITANQALSHSFLHE